MTPAVHAYYALVAALGFICPLAASSVTATHFNYGGAHVETGKKLKRYGLDFRYEALLHILPSFRNLTSFVLTGEAPGATTANPIAGWSGLSEPFKGNDSASPCSCGAQAPKIVPNRSGDR